MDTRAVAVQQLPDDCCPYPRPFAENFDACVTFQAQVFVAATSRGEPLGSHVGCVHLRVGETARNKFYARCALGDAAERRRWLAQIGEGRVDALRALQGEFEHIAGQHRAGLIAAKARSLAAPADQRARAELDGLVADFAADCDRFLASRAHRYEGIGFPVAELHELLRQVLDGWRRGSTLEAAPLDERQLRRFSPELRAFLGDAGEVQPAG